MDNRVLVRFLLVVSLSFVSFVPRALAQQSAPEMRDAALVVGSAAPFGPTDGILRYDGGGAFVDNMVSVGTQGIAVPCCMTFGPDENLYVSSPLASKVERFNGVTGAFMNTFVSAGSGGLVIPLVLQFYGDYLYVGDTATGAIRRYNAQTGVFVDNFIPDNSHGIGTPFDLQWFGFGPDGKFYVAAEISKRVLRYDGMTGVFIDEFVPAAAGFSPSALTFGPDGQMYVGSPESSEVRRYDLQTANYDVFIASGGRLKQPTGVAFGPDGNFYITAVATAEILHYDGKTGQFLGPFVTSGLGGLTGGRAIEWKATTRVCHHSGGNPAKAKTLKIGYLSARDHLAHGDSLGACP